MEVIVRKNFFNRMDSNLYKKWIGWDETDYQSAMSTNDRDVLKCCICGINGDLTGVYSCEVMFYYLEDNQWYFILNWMYDKAVLMRLRDREDWDGKFIEERYVSANCEEYAQYADVLFEGDREELLDFELDGVALWKVLPNSFIAQGQA